MLRRLLGLLFLSSAAHAAPADTPDQWGVAKLRSGNSTLLARYRSELPTWVNRASWTQRILITLRSAGEMPNRAESSRNYEIEDAVQDTVEASKSGVLALVLTGDHKVEWHFYSSNKEEFMRKLNEALQVHPRQPLEIVFSDDSAWSEYTAIQSRGKQR